MRTIDWESNSIRIIDQTALPGELSVITLETIDALVDAIRRLAVRGAPALGAAGALGVALAAVIYNGDEDRVRQAAVTVREAAIRRRIARIRLPCSRSISRNWGSVASRLNCSMSAA